MCPQPQKNQQRVSFASSEQVIAIEPINNEEDKALLWYSKQDLKKVRSGEEKASKVDGQRRRDFVIALLGQQSEHNTLGIQDPKGLYQFSRACSKTSRQKALKDAREHEQEVKVLSREATIEAIDSVLDILALDDIFA